MERKMSRKSSGAQTIVFCIICRAPCRDRRLAAGREDAQGLDHAVAASGRNGARASEGCVRRVLCVKIIVLSTSAPIEFVWRRDFQYLDPHFLHEAKQACPITAARLDADAQKFAERSHPGEHLPVSLSGRGKASRSQNTVTFIDDRRDMQIFVGIDASDDSPCRTCFHIHVLPVQSLDGFAKTECLDRTVTRPKGQALLGSHASARQNLTARRSRTADRSRERHDGRSE